MTHIKLVFFFLYIYIIIVNSLTLLCIVMNRVIRTLRGAETLKIYLYLLICVLRRANSIRPTFSKARSKTKHDDLRKIGPDHHFKSEEDFKLTTDADGCECVPAKVITVVDGCVE